ncbi:hypothetical protein BAE44_0023919 [Dichanthelium oligosanthes]|uniref:T-complex protein 11 n=1 Tax=Dichanthelium oligosanthes TaxID=888268 RepID=A0A1E5UQ83_9POAL|nr:hypothetical protein BAE44_0023919 [Dichanthelium oligosanthes]
MESAAIFVKEFKVVTKMILNGPGRSPHATAGQSRFRAHLADFDKAWCAYLYRFVAWKVKDARVLEEDLARAACKLELSMMQTCKVTEDGQSPSNLTHDMQAIQKQVTDSQKLLREKVQQLSGDAGIERMNTAISDARSKFFEAKKNGNSVAAPVANVSAPLSVDSSSGPAKLPTENEQTVNKMLHQDGSAFDGRSDGAGTAEKDFQNKVRETMEKAFWDMVSESLTGEKPDYSQSISLVKEVRDSLHELAPKQWKEEIVENIDLEILSQVLGSGSQDAQYLGQILQYSLHMVRKLSAAAREDEMKKSHDKLLSELAACSEVGSNGISSFVIAQALSGQPECKGEKLDKLIRIGLLQLISSMEGLQMQSTPESFQINLMRLRAVQSQFQVIVISTSMLILRQVLMAESSNPAPVNWKSHLGTLQGSREDTGQLP